MADSQRPSGLDRRTFLRRLAGVGGAWLSGSALGCSPADGGAEPASAARVPGVQLYTVRDRLAEDFAGTVEQVAEIGYKELEFAGYYDWTPEQVRLLLERLGLSAPSTHVSLDQLRRSFEPTLGAAKIIGHRYLTVPYLSDADRGTLEDYSRVAADLNRFGEAARKQGVRLAYHNHDFEFEPKAGGRTGYDVLLNETDPELVDMELDLFWTVRAGHDPVQLFARNPGRFALCHVKDLVKRQGEPDMAPVGQGEIDFAEIFAHAEEAGLKHYFVEHDRPKDSLASLRTSYPAVSRLLS